MMHNVCVTWRDIVECELRTPPVVLSCFLSFFFFFFKQVLILFRSIILCSECEYYCMGSLDKVSLLI